MSNTLNNGLFITFEGSEGVGKSTHINLLAKFFEDYHYDVLLVREPGGTVVGEEIRHLVKHIHGADAPTPAAELLLFCAARAQLLEKKILPHLAKGGVVICDRFADSTTAYQGFGRGWDLKQIEALHDISVGERWPDITLLMRVELTESHQRCKDRETAKGGTVDRMEQEGIDFYGRVNHGFDTLLNDNPERFVAIDAAGSKDNTASQIQVAVKEWIAKQ